MAKLLEAWFERFQRPLPWRKTRDPYAVLVSEVMLQQTQVTTVLPYYEKFLKLFPNWKALATASEQSILQAWSGLGYYRRVKLLQKTAMAVAEKKIFPQTREEALELPGIGPYTAGALLSIAFDQKEPLVDGNVKRVFARLFALSKPLGTPSQEKEFWKIAQDWIAKCHSPRVFNQALMELGATTCRKAAPLCLQCPLQKDCLAFQKGLQEKLPVPVKRKETLELFWAPILYESKQNIWLNQDPTARWWKGMWDLPRLEAPSLKDLENQIQDWKKKLPQKAEVTSLGRFTHTVTHHKIHCRPLWVNYAKEPSLVSLKKLCQSKGLWQLMGLQEVEHEAISSLTRKVISGSFHQLPLEI